MIPPEPSFVATVVLFGISGVLTTFVAVRMFYLALPFLSLLRTSANTLEPTSIGTGFGFHAHVAHTPIFYDALDLAEENESCPE